MWKDYLVSYMKHNRASSLSVMAAAFISALFLSLLCCLSFNIWQYDVEQIILEEGDWQGRITGALSDEAIALIENFGNVEKIVEKPVMQPVDREALSGKSKQVVDIYFKNPKTIYEEMPLLANQLGLGTDAIMYHEILLSRYLIPNPQDGTPPLLLSFYLSIIAAAACSMILIIRNAFAVSMNARIHQFGIFSSIGATPKQIRICLLQEAVVLCLAPVLLGDMIGVILSYGMIQTANALAADVVGRHYAVFQYDPLIFAGTFLISAVTVFFSAWLPARKLSRLTPLEAIRNADGLQFKKKPASPILTLLFGIEGELAGASLNARRKALRTTMLSLTLSFFAFALFYNFAAFSRLSVYETSFSKYKDYWDIMATLKDTPMEKFEELDRIRELENVESPVLYQKAEAYTEIPLALQSNELTALGGLAAVHEDAAHMEEETYLVKVPIVVLDDDGFTEYCRQAGVKPQTDGGIIINKVWDSLHSNFRNRNYVPFVKETEDKIRLRNRDGEKSAEVPVIGYTAVEPVLWEQYEDYTLVQILPLSVWNTISETVESVDADTRLRILAFDDTKLNEVMAEIQKMLEHQYTVEIHNRVQDLAADEQMWSGLYFFMSSGCVLLAVIGIANIFSHTLGFVCQRKREFAQYLSVGVTPKGIEKILWIEALAIAGKPILVTLPLTVLSMIFIIKASYMEINQFFPVAPVLPMLAYMAAIFLFVGLAYYLGGKRLLQSDLSEMLRNDLV